MIGSELAELLENLQRPDRFWPVLVWANGRWQTVEDLRLDEDRIILTLGAVDV